MSLFRISTKLRINNVLQDTKIKKLHGVFLVNRLSTVQYSYEKDPAPIFFKTEIQLLLKTMSRVDLAAVFKRRKLGDKKLDQPVYKFMTDEQLQSALKEAHSRAEEMLQMPPVVQQRADVEEVLSTDPELQGLDTARFVFTDITFGKKNSERLIVVREPDGILRKAEWTLRDRMNQVYFPVRQRELRIPKMFDEDNLKALLNRKEYEFILDRACLQFEPHDPEYHKVTNATYLHVNDNNRFDSLRSTRHFGPLTFFLTWFKMVDNLLLELIETGCIDEARKLVELYGRVHCLNFDTKSADLLETFIKDNAKKKAPLELALQAYKELEKERQELEKGIGIAHGRL